MATLWEVFTAKEKLCWYLHRFFNKFYVANRGNKYLKAANHYFAKVWIRKYMEWGRSQRQPDDNNR